MIRCITIDDEPLALKQIAGYIEKTPFLELKGQFQSALQAMEFLSSDPVDLMYVDINMPDLNGIDFVRSLNNAPKIIFITAYNEYALEGFRVNALDYLLKPVSYGDFLRSANKAAKFYEDSIVTDDERMHDMKYLFVKAGYKVVRICLDDIIYIEGKREYVLIHLKNNKTIMPLISLTLLEKQLPSDNFMRVHRSYIVNLKEIVTIDHYVIVFDKNIYIPVSEQYKEIFQNFISSHSLG